MVLGGETSANANHLITPKQFSQSSTNCEEKSCRKPPPEPLENHSGFKQRCGEFRDTAIQISTNS
jgi:hypothetical protein